MPFDQTTTELVKSIAATFPFDAYTLAAKRGDAPVTTKAFSEGTSNADVAAMIGRSGDGTMAPYAVGWRMREVETGQGAEHQRYSVGVAAGPNRWIFILDGKGMLLKENPVSDTTDQLIVESVFLDLS
jgi:hypothetical protein